MGELIDVKAIVEVERQKIKQRVQTLQERHQINPKLQVIMVGEHAASMSYVAGKHKAAAAVGVQVDIQHLDRHATEEELVEQIIRCNKDNSVHGIIVQLPLPDHMQEARIIAAIDPAKDVDGFTAVHQGNLVTGGWSLQPCTPKGIMVILQAVCGSIAGKHVVIVGRSNIVGKPMALLALAADATVTITHSHTHALASLTAQADILIVATGRAKMIDASFVKEGAVVIDVGVNRIAGKLYGDVDTRAVLPIARAITPVPGGVGPMTIAMLLTNVVEAAEAQIDQERRKSNVTTI